ncbi:MAG: RidA family protein [Rhizobacter sp.]|nr:RidA family protein [Rhizobacter sp.]
MRFARRTIATKSLPAPRFRYTPLVAAGPFVFVSGLVGLDAATGSLAPGGAYGEARQILANLQAVVTEHGWSMEQIVCARLFCTDFTRFPDINRAWDEAFAGSEPPARTSVGVAALPLGAAVEMEFQLVVAETA